MAPKDYDHVEVTLARDLKVGPQGGLRKADTNITLPAGEAQLLINQGKARLAKSAEKDFTPDGQPAVTLGEDSTGGAAPGDKK